MSFEEFCKTNCMEESEISGFKDFLEKRNDSLEKRTIPSWLYLFNLYFDN